MAFISGHGYPMQNPGFEDYERAIAQLRHPVAGPRFLKRLPRLGLDRNPSMRPVRRAIEQAAAASARGSGTPTASAPT